MSKYDKKEIEKQKFECRSSMTWRDRAMMNRFSFSENDNVSLLTFQYDWHRNKIELAGKKYTVYSNDEFIR